MFNNGESLVKITVSGADHYPGFSLVLLNGLSVHVGGNHSKRLPLKYESEIIVHQLRIRTEKLSIYPAIDCPRNKP